MLSTQLSTFPDIPVHSPSASMRFTILGLASAIISAIVAIPTPDTAVCQAVCYPYEPVCKDGGVSRILNHVNGANKVLQYAKKEDNSVCWVCCFDQPPAPGPGCPAH